MPQCGRSQWKQCRLLLWVPPRSFLHRRRHRCCVPIFRLYNLSLFSFVRSLPCFTHLGGGVHPQRHTRYRCLSDSSPSQVPPCILISARRGGHSLYTRRFPLCLPFSSLSDAWSQQNTRATSGVEYRHQVTFEIQSKRQLDGSLPVEQYLFSTYVFHTICF